MDVRQQAAHADCASQLMNINDARTTFLWRSLINIHERRYAVSHMDAALTHIFYYIVLFYSIIKQTDASPPFKIIYENTRITTL